MCSVSPMKNQRRQQRQSSDHRSLTKFYQQLHHGVDVHMSLLHDW